MQQLLTGKKRLSGFSGEWETYTIEEIAINLDNLRIPLNENQRSKMRGDIPYCGANGVVGTVNDYVIDDDILLMAEDGGYFDEWATRPIVYRMIGKCWVNNHAHILKAKENFSQDYLFYSLVHKDITKFLASGTRAKLNKSEMYKIEVFAPKNIAEQQEISQILSDMDNEIETLKQKLSKTKAIKDGIMSELLTGKTRLKVKDE
jgi:type I restriction enzyme, S subunit